MVSEKPRSPFMAVLRILGYRVWNCRAVILLSVLAICLSILIYVLSDFAPVVMEVLAVSSKTPWGVFTAVFVHGSFKHLMDNVAGLAMFTVYLVVASLHTTGSNAERRSHFTVLLVSGDAIASNVFWLAIAPNQPAIGASGLVYALVGVTTGFFLANTLELLAAPFSLRNEELSIAMSPLLDKKRKRLDLFLWLVTLLLNLGLLANLLFFVVSTPALFLNVSPGTNSIVHGLAFLIALTATGAYSILRRRASLPRIARTQQTQQTQSGVRASWARATQNGA